MSDHVYIEYDEIDDLISKGRVSKKLVQKMIDRKNKTISDQQALIEKQAKVIGVLNEAISWYAACDDVGVKARQTQKQVEEILK